MTDQGNAITVWAFHDAPAELRALSEHGGDEDWLAVLPAAFREFPPLWMDEGTAFGVCSVSRHELGDGRFVLIGAHS